MEVAKPPRPRAMGVVQAPPKLAFIHPYNFLFLFLNKKSL
jgi:hypothetical protein